MKTKPPIRSQAYHDGVSDYHKGKRLKDNPYRGKNGEGEWRDGWKWASAFKAAEKR